MGEKMKKMEVKVSKLYFDTTFEKIEEYLMVLNNNDGEKNDGCMLEYEYDLSMLTDFWNVDFDEFLIKNDKKIELYPGCKYMSSEIILKLPEIREQVKNKWVIDNAYSDDTILEIALVSGGGSRKCMYVRSDCLVNIKKYAMSLSQDLDIKFDMSEKDFVCMADFVLMNGSYYATRILGTISYTNNNGLISMESIEIDSLVRGNTDDHINIAIDKCINLFNRCALHTNQFNRHNGDERNLIPGTYKVIHNFGEVGIKFDDGNICCLFKNTSKNVDQFIYAFENNQLVLEVLTGKGEKVSNTDPIPELFRTNNCCILEKSILN